MAIKAQQTLLKVESAARAAAKTITGITAANPPVVSSTSHGYIAGDVVYIDGVIGMTQVNGRAFVVANPISGSFELKGIDGTGYSTYASGGSAYKTTLTEIGEVRGVEGFDGQASEDDTTHLRSLAMEFQTGLQDFGNVTLSLGLIVDAGQTKLNSLKESANAAVFTITLSDGRTSAFLAFVKSFTFSAQRNVSVAGQVVLRVTGAPAWFA